MSPGDADALRVMNSIRRIVRALRASSSEAERAVGVSGAQLFVLSELAERSAESLSELADRTTTDASSVSVVVQKLVDKGLVVRTPSPTDARRAEISLSKKGRDLLRKAPSTAQRRMVEAIDGLPSVQRKRLADGLEALVHGIGADAEAPMLFFEDGAAKKAASKPGGKKAPRGAR